MMRRAWIGAHADVTQKRQCVLAGVSRTTVYVKRKAVLFVEADEVLKRLIDEEYTRHPFYGSRKMVVYLGRCGHRVNRKRVQRFMRSMSLAGMAPGPNTSAAHPLHKVYPYLLRGVPVVRANQVWSTGMAESFVKTLKRDYAKLGERPDSQTVMAQLPKWFDDYNSYHPHSALGYVLPKLFREKRAVKLNIPTVLGYGVKTTT